MILFATGKTEYRYHNICFTLDGTWRIRSKTGPSCCFEPIIATDQPYVNEERISFSNYFFSEGENYSITLIIWTKYDLNTYKKRKDPIFDFYEKTTTWDKVEFPGLEGIQRKLIIKEKAYHKEEQVILLDNLIQGIEHVVLEIQITTDWCTIEDVLKKQEVVDFLTSIKGISSDGK